MFYRLLSSAALALCLSAFAASAQTVNQTAGIYYAYPGPRSEMTPAPEGYSPFYISHYGRHGSRWITDDDRYTRVYEVFDTTALTPLGEDVKARLDVVLNDALGRSGALSPVGERQHHDIASRMYINFPEVFVEGGVVDAASSTSLRCVMSMSYFTEALKERNPSLQVHRAAYDKDMDFIAYTSPEGRDFSSNDAPWRADHAAYELSIIHPDRLIGSLFADPDVFTPAQKLKIASDLYWIASDMQDVDVNLSFYDIFEYDELLAFWRGVNARMYICNGDSPLSGGVMKHCADNLLSEIIDCADAAVEAVEDSQYRGVAANLRFGHDTHLLRLLTLMGIEGCTVQEPDMERIHEVWQDYNLSPMAANLQLVYYVNDDEEVLVKLLLNEDEVRLPIPSDTAPYYSWPDVRDFWSRQLTQ